MSQKIVEGLAVLCELTGTDFSEGAVKAILADLSTHEESEVLKAFGRVRHEHQGRLTLAAIVSRIDTGHPSPEEAWAIAKPAVEGEEATVVWTDQIAAAARAAASLSDDMIAARMCFLESYRKEIAKFTSVLKPSWFASVGFDKAGCASAIFEAVDKRRLSPEVAIKYLPDHREEILKIAESKKELAVAQISSPPTEGKNA